jgi:hypothetical protein
MTRPDWCDDATWEAADDLMDAVLGEGIMQGAPNSQSAIARALLAAEQRGAERERLRSAQGHIDMQGATAGSAAAAAIRGRKA